MFNIKTLNEISGIIGEALTPEHFAVSKECENPDAILVRSADMQEAQLGDDLLSIARAGVGYNNVPVSRCSGQGIVVFNTPGANANAVKELAIMSIILASRPALQAIEWGKTLKGKGADVPKLVEKGKSQFVGPEIKGKTLGVLGLGAIGGLVANAARALGMDVYGYDQFMSVESAWALSRAVHRTLNEEELIAKADYLSVHIPLVDAPNPSPTRGKFNAELIGKMKRGAVLLNFSRGELAVDEDIIAALADGHLRAYVTDFPSDALLDVPGVIAIPHLGASTPESEENCAQMAAEQTRDYLLTGSIHNSVNLPECILPPTDLCRVAVIHKNAPNMISRVTSAIGAHGINIANMVNKSRGDLAYTVCDCDERVNDEAIAMLRGMDTVVRVRVIG